MKKRLTFAVFFIFLFSCGKKAPPVPPSPPKPSAPQLKTGLLSGYGGYKLGNDGFAALYWDFPTSVEYSEIYLNGKKVATVKGYTYLYTQPLEKGKTYTFEVVGFSKGKPKAKVEIRINY